jgi:hypothetical protein
MATSKAKNTKSSTKRPLKAKSMELIKSLSRVHIGPPA